MFRWKAAAVAAAAAVLLTGCAGTSGGGSAGDSASATLRLGAVATPTSYDPAGATWGDTAPYFQAVYDTLLRATADGRIVPFLASKWSYNADNTVLTLTIRKGVTFSDGTALTPEVVAENLRRFKAGTSTDASYLANVAKIEATGSTVVLTLTAPDPALVDYLSRSAGVIGSAKMFTAKDAATDPVGSGPYILDRAKTVAGSSYLYKKNPHYWDPALQHYSSLTITVLSDATAALNAIKGGQIDAMRLLNNDSINQITASGWSVNPMSLDFQGFLLFDRGGKLTPALGDVRVRQAINDAIDRKALLKALQNNLGTVTEQVFPTRSAAYDPALDHYYPYDPAKAKQLLAAAGYANGLTITMPSSSVFGANTYLLLEQEFKDVGITLKDVDTPVASLATDMLAPKYSATYMSLEENNDWQLINFMIAPTATFNPFHYSDPKVDALIHDIQYGTVATQQAKAKELNRYIVQQAWFAPFYRAQNSFATAPDTKVARVPSNVYPAIYDFHPAAK